MITNSDRQVLRPLIGHRYTVKIKEILKEFQVKTTSGEEYSPQFITHVFNGRFENQGIETAFFELADRNKTIIQKNEKLRKKILKTKKPEATTPGSN